MFQAADGGDRWISSVISLDRSAFTTVADSLLAAGFKLRFRAGGHSMGTAVRDGERVTVAPVDARDVDVGDIVLCQTWRGPVAHRVQWIERAAAGAARFVLRGDASFEDDRPVAAGQLRGRVVSVERDGRAIDLAVRGGALGRRLFVAALRARVALTAATRDVLATFAASVVSVPRSADGLESSGR